MGSKSVITGITGQDGSYLAELLLNKGYSVYGLVRNTTNKTYPNIAHIKHRITLVEGDILDRECLQGVMEKTQFDEIYHLAAQSNVGTSFLQPVATYQYNAIGTHNILSVTRVIQPKARVYNAATSELFGNSSDRPQHELTPMKPRSPYAISKLSAYWDTVYHREAYGLFAVNGILFNHESPRRGENFVTRKITKGIADIFLGNQKYLQLGNIKTFRDWGFAGDYVYAMWLMLQQKKAEDFVIGTGETHSVENFLYKAFELAGLDPERHVVIDESLYRPADVHYLVADASKARKKLGWKPLVNFDDLIAMMLKHDLEEQHAKSTREKVTIAS